MSVTTVFGDMYVYFSAAVKPINITNLNPETIDLGVLVSEERKLEDGFDPAKLNFTWETAKMTPEFI